MVSIEYEKTEQIRSPFGEQEIHAPKSFSFYGWLSNIKGQYSVPSISVPP